MLKKRGKKAQQEMIGFALIVIIVVVALMIFLVIQIRNPVRETKSSNVQNLLTSVLKQKTNCVVSEPYYETVRELIRSCYENRDCKNLNQKSCEYLNSTLSEMMEDLSASDATISAYEVEIVWEDSEQETRQRLVKFFNGQCSGGVGGGSEFIDTSDGMIKIFLKLC